MANDWTPQDVERVRELSRIRASHFRPHVQAPCILGASRDALIRLTEIQGLRFEVEEQIEATLEACDLERLRRFLAFSWEPESLQEGLETLREVGIETPAS